MMPSLQTDLISIMDDWDMLNSLRMLQLTHQWVWPQLRAIYEVAAPRSPTGNWIFIHRHQLKTLEPRWKGQFIVLMTMLMTLKGDSITTWCNTPTLSSCSVCHLRGLQRRHMGMGGFETSLQSTKLNLCHGNPVKPR